MAEDRTFTLIGKFDDQITKKLESINKLLEGITKTLKSIEPETKKVSKSFDSITQSVSGVARAASRAAENVSDIGNAAGRANGQADDLMRTLLKAEGLSKVGDAMAKGFERGMSGMAKTAKAGAGVITKLFRESMEDEMADIKAASGIQGSFKLAGYSGSFNESEKMYKQYDRVVSEMIRQSSAPTAKVVELQRYTLDTMGPLMLAAQGVKKGTAMKDIDPKKIEASAAQYGQFLEKAALFSQGTGSAGFRVAAGIEGLVTRGKIDTQLDFFTDNIMLMKNLEAAGFAGRNTKTSDMMTATDAVRMKKMMDAFNKSMSSESTAAMAQSLTGSLQGLQDTIFNPSVGILGMSVTFSKGEQKKANEAIIKIQNARIMNYRRELLQVGATGKRAEELRNNIEQAERTRDTLTKDGADKISTPFKAFSYAFTGIVRALTNALNAIGPVWTQFAVAAIEVTNRVFGPLAETLENVASDMRANPNQQMKGFGRIMGEIYKAVGEMMGDLANMITDPNSAMGKAQSEFMKGFMEAFKEPGSLEKAKENLNRGIWALFRKIGDVLLTVLGSEEARPFVLTALALAFGPPFVSAVIAGATPLLIDAIGKISMGLLARSTAATAAAPAVARGLGMNAAYLSGGAATGAGAGAGAVGGLATIPVLGWIAALGAALVIFETPVMALTNAMQDIGKSFQKSDNWLTSAFGQFVQGIGQLVGGITKFFNGLWEIISGLFSGDSKRVIAGVKKLFSSIVDVFVGIGRTVGGLGGMVVGAIGNLFRTLSDLILLMIRKIPGLGWLMAPGQAGPSTLGDSINVPNLNDRNNNVWNSAPKTKVPSLPQYSPLNGFGYRYKGGIGDAISSEMRNKPPGSNLVIANSSETIIPAAGGLGMKELFRTLDERSMGTINAPITIHQQPGQNAEQLAALVAMELGNAIRHSRASSVYV